MEKTKINKKLRLAVEEIHKQYSNLQGILLYGSFIKSNPNPQDIDILLVLVKRESERENPLLRGQELIEEYFTKYFPNFSKPKVIVKSGLNGNTNHRWIKNILHAGDGVVYLEEPDDLRKKVKKIGVGLEYFIGTEEATLCVSNILE